MKMNIGIKKEEVIDVELKEGKKIALSEVDTDERLLSYKGRQVLLYIRDHGDHVQAALEDGSEGTQVSSYFLPHLEGDEER